MNTGIAVLYIKSSHTPRSIAVVENGAIKWYSTLGYSAPTVTYSSNQLIMGDSVYASQPEAIDYIAF